MADTNEPVVESQGEDVPNLACRFYENKYPQADDLVVVMVRNVTHMGAYVSLLEYGGIEGMILLSELSRRRIRSINKLIRVGRIETVMVLRVDEEKGYIDLSKRRVSPEDIAAHEDKYSKSKAVHSILRHVAETTKTPLIKLYENFGWDLYKRYGHAHDAFTQIVIDPEPVLGQYNLPTAQKTALVNNIRRKLTPQPVKIRADIEVTCFAYEGIDAIKDALRAGEALSTEEQSISIHLIAPPTYVMSTTSLDKKLGIKLLEDACDAVRETITKAGGTLAIKEKARAINEKDEKRLAELMAKLERENAEVAGDDEKEA